MWSILVFFIFGCASKQPSEAIQPRIEPQASPEHCLDACLSRNQMRAVAIEQIRSDCEQECNQIADPTLILQPSEDSDNPQ